MMGPDRIPRIGLLAASRRLVLLSLMAALPIIGMITPSFALLPEETEDCTLCHGSTTAEAHGNIDHTVDPGAGTVAIFEDAGHDDAGWYGPKPYFGIPVDCTTCHAGNLLAIHADQCWTCHTAPYDEEEKNWSGCQGCHSVYHGDIETAHLPFENPYDYQGNDCNLCHENSDWGVPQSNCLNCHAAYGSRDVVPPVTATNAQATYDGPARIAFSISDNDKVGIGTTFYRLDGGPETVGSHVFVTAPGSHDLEFWSVDQAGNVESPPNLVSFTTVEDTAPPVTTSDAQATYQQGGTITLTATDGSTLGVKNTYFSLNGGPVQTGTKVQIPATSGSVEYTLLFWSEDWSGNVETQNSVTFTVTSGNGTLRLIWGNSDVSGSPCWGDPEAKASWTIRRGGSWGPVAASGSGSCPDWSGVNDVIVPVGSTSYFILVEWWDSYFGFYDGTVYGSVTVDTPGQVIRLPY